VPVIPVFFHVLDAAKHVVADVIELDSLTAGEQAGAFVGITVVVVDGIYILYIKKIFNLFI